jgi:hypothetical protein
VDNEHNSVMLHVGKMKNQLKRANNTTPCALLRNVKAHTKKKKKKF